MAMNQMQQMSGAIEGDSGLRPSPSPRLHVIVQPNKNQKRRYNSDGPTRGQIKDDSGDRVPTVRLDNYPAPVLMFMMACTSNGEPHPFFELQSVDKCGCKQSQLDKRPAVVTETSPEKAMEARFAACLKRLAMRTVQETSEHDFTKWKCESEKVHLGFLAAALPDHVPLASCLSDPIHMVQGRSLEMKRIVPSTGNSAGENTICITGKNFPSSTNVKVRFFLTESSDKEVWESYGDVDNSDSSEKHLVVTVPRGPSVCSQREMVQVGVEVLPGTTTQTRSKCKHLYYTYTTQSPGGPSQTAMAAQVKGIRNTLATAREGAQHLFQSLEQKSALGMAPYLDPDHPLIYPGQASVSRLPTSAGPLQTGGLSADPGLATAAAAAGNQFRPMSGINLPTSGRHVWFGDQNAREERMDLSLASSEGTTLMHQPLHPSMNLAHPAMPSNIKVEHGLKRGATSTDDRDMPSAKMPHHAPSGPTSQLPNGTAQSLSGSSTSLQHIPQQHPTQAHHALRQASQEMAPIDNFATGMFSPDDFSQPSPSQHSTAGTDTFPNMQTEGGFATSMQGRNEDLPLSDINIPGDLFANFDQYGEDTLSRILQATEARQRTLIMPHQPQSGGAIHNQFPTAPP